MLCRIESTDAGQRSAGSGPVSLVRETTSPASLHGYCLRDLDDFVDEVDAAGLFATPEQRRIAEAARRTGDRGAGYTACPSWRGEKDNTRVKKLVDLPGERRIYGAEGVRAA